MKFSKKNILKFIPGIAWFFLVLVLICLPPSNIPPVDDWLSKLYFDKWVHAGLFAILAFLFIFAVHKLPVPKPMQMDYALRITLATIIWGLITEFIQKFFIPGRAFDWFDWLADTSGAILAFLFCKKWLFK